MFPIDRRRSFHIQFKNCFFSLDVLRVGSEILCTKESLLDISAIKVNILPSRRKQRKVSSRFCRCGRVPSSAKT